MDNENQEAEAGSPTTRDLINGAKGKVISKVVNNLTAKIMKSKLWGKSEDEAPAKQ